MRVELYALRDERAVFLQGFELLFLFLQIQDQLFTVGLALLGLKSLAHPKSDGALVHSLVGGNRHPDLVPNPEQQQPALGTINGDFPNKFICTGAG